MKGIYLKNHSSIPQQAFTDDGQKLEMGPSTVQMFSEEQATLFLDQCKHVKEHTPMVIPSDGFSGQQMWVANNTGNPHQPDKVRVRDYDRARKISFNTEVENQTKTAKVFIRNYNLGQVRGRDQRGNEIFLNKGTIPIEIPPYFRCPVPLEMAQWLLESCANRLPEMRNEIIICRAPTKFEPNETWELDDILVYGNMVHKNFTKDFGLHDATRFRHDIYGEQKEKIRALNWLFFYLIDDRYTLPLKKMFEAHKRRLAGDLEDDRIDAEIAAKENAVALKSGPPLLAKADGKK